jgi:regulation of enolase protein 1 (concanavalin A-like superfamily)
MAIGMMVSLFTGLNKITETLAAGAGAVDGTTGAPLGGIGAGAVKFCSNNGTFAYAERTPCAIDNFKAMANTLFQFYSNRGGTVQTSTQLVAVSNSGRYDDDAIYPTQTANFGVINNVAVNLTAFSPVNFSSVDQMCYPYAFFEISVVNNLTTAVDVSCAFQLGTSVAPTAVAGKGFTTTGGIERAIYGKSNDAGAIISYGNDNGFLTSGQCNNSLSGTTNKTAVKVTLGANQTKYIKFVYAWYNGSDPTRYYYANAYSNAAGFADLGLTNFDTLKTTAVNLVTRMRASNFPDWIKNHTLNSLCNLTTNSVYAKDGRYCHTEGEWNINGTMDQMWHARQINTMTVPSIAWKELEYWGRTQKTSPVGQIHHDFGTPMSNLCAFDDAQHGDYRNIDKWVDLNCGFIVSIYEAFMATDDHTKLDYFWPYAKKAGQRVLDLVASYGNATYPYTFDSTENSYDAGGNPDPFNASMSAVAYKVMSNYAQIEGDNTLKTTYDNAFNTVTNSFKNRYLSGNFPTGRICESVMAGQWLAYYLKLGEFYPATNIDYALGCLDSYYHPLANGMGYTSGTYNEWAPYLISHYGGLLLQTGRLPEWRSMQYDLYERAYLNRNKVFNQPLDILPKVGTPSYVATDISCYNQYISTPVLWRNYYSLLGYQRNKHTGELWIEPIIPSEMNHVMTDGLFISPEGYGTISCTESGTSYQNQNITIKSDNNISVNGIYLKDKFGTNVSVTVGGVTQSISRIGSGYNKEIKVSWSGTVGSGGINIVATGDATLATPTAPPTTSPTPTPTAVPKSAFAQIEAESYNSMSGVQTETCSDTGGGQDVGYIENPDFTVYSNLNFGSGATSFDARVASGTSGGNIEVRLDSATGTLVGTCAVAGTGGWQTWVTKSCSISGATGIHDLYLKFTGGTGYLFNINWFKFYASGATATPAPTSTPTSTPTVTPTATSTPTPTPTATPGGPTATPVAGNDEFNSNTLGSQWSWVREDNTHWSLTAVSGYMRITTQTGDIYQTYADAKNILLQTATGDWTITTKMTFKPTQNYQAAGLIVYQDDNNYIKMARAYVSANKFQFATEVGGTFANSEATDSISSNISYLKIVKSGNNYSGYFSSDGTTYTQVWTTQTVSLSTIKIGLIAINSYPVVSELPADFDYFHKN